VSIKRKLIYGVSVDHSLGKLTYQVYVFFTSEAAENWLKSKKNFFETREILKDRRKAVRFIGNIIVDEAEPKVFRNEEKYGCNKEING